MCCTNHSYFSTLSEHCRNCAFQVLILPPPPLMLGPTERSVCTLCILGCITGAAAPCHLVAPCHVWPDICATLASAGPMTRDCARDICAHSAIG
ncbi:hypothetical protein OBBRIDRAFT_293280 [Obba rivulosa]|uniref:Uncharacterized protein n=1 Tax=Obba rivulosa TaxID=1052685 RepID=A0A8E2DPX9_9APHY|nr:hypothetical protein OBBRIDRAFT_293280 [Obba rivulosa]